MTKRIIAMHGREATDADRAKTLLPPDPNRVVHTVRPRETDPAISKFLQDHYAMLYKGRPHNGKLFLFFPGTFGRPQNTQFVLDTAAQAGYLALGLEYVNTTDDPERSAVGMICADNPDPACGGKIRHDRIFNGPDGALNRIQKALALLHKRYPDEGWSTFLNSDGSLRWNLVAVGGHSQGGGMAAYLGKQFSVARVCLFSAGVDWSRAAGRFASWLSEPGKTPSDRYFGMVHEKESGAKGILLGYKVLNMKAAQIFTVTLTPAKGISLGDAEHGSTASDASTPKSDSGAPLYAEVWRKIIGQ